MNISQVTRIVTLKKVMPIYLVYSKEFDKEWIKILESCAAHHGVQGGNNVRLTLLDAPLSFTLRVFTTY